MGTDKSSMKVLVFAIVFAVVGAFLWHLYGLHGVM
jgi:hypothetical protein